VINLQDILKSVNVLEHDGNLNVQIQNVHIDSRKIETNDLFIAIKGSQVDGHRFIDKAIELGASVIVCEDYPNQRNSKIAYIKVANAADASGFIASSYYGDPSQNLKLVGVTGTNGKTTIATLLYQMFTNLGYKTGLLSTICNYVGSAKVEATHTTPDPIQLNKLLADMVATGCDYCFMEVSSHAAHQKRIAGLHFTGGAFTNITQDHLDYHKTFSEYISAKKLFFDALPKGAFALINNDDKNGNVMLQNTKAKKLTYALKSMANYRGKIIESRMDGTLVQFNNIEIWTRFIGEFNSYNLLAVYGVALELGQNPDEVVQVLSSLQNVPGRFQYLKSPQGKIAIVDYAHTPDAVENVLKTIQQIREGDVKIITVVGAGGNRDKTKRPLMAAIAAKLSNHVVLTSDNPRNENPDDIINDMREGVLPPYNNRLLSITNRKEAIRTACALAQPGDIILVAGKGHENYQEIDGIKHHFDDIEVLSEIFETT